MSSKLRVGEWGGDEVSGVEKLKKPRSESPGARGLSPLGLGCHPWRARVGGKARQGADCYTTEGPGLRRDRRSRERVSVAAEEVRQEGPVPAPLGRRALLPLPLL